MPCYHCAGWWWCNGVGMFSWHTLGPLVPIGHRLNATAYLSIVSDHVYPFMATMYPSSGYFQQDNAQHRQVFESSPDIQYFVILCQLAYNVRAS